MSGMAVFDMNETTLDLGPVRDVIDRTLGHPGAAGMWFGRLLQLSMAVSATGRYESFTDLARAALDSVSDSVRGRSAVTDPEWNEVRQAILTLPPHRDVAPGLDALRAGGWRLFALTNSAQAAVDAQLANAGIADRFEAIVSVEAVQVFKPTPRPYRHIASVAAADPSDLWMVASHDWDLAGAKAVGMRTAFVERPGTRFNPIFPPADLVVGDFVELAERLLES